ncbi:hypothetical protein G6O67_001911 [Ophiocordyceps sinensis]|uniref:Uncharacterized protein n=1 Tax=Ophiocordyceps sinensis TaxID=72228 RepID=A0A8H4PT20_9HYPO|nr:hypothetical protein G6O67_001911 [Ophiocordyceps sinensis]
MGLLVVRHPLVRLRHEPDMSSPTRCRPAQISRHSMSRLSDCLCLCLDVESRAPRLDVAIRCSCHRWQPAPRSSEYCREPCTSGSPRARLQTAILRSNAVEEILDESGKGPGILLWKSMGGIRIKMPLRIGMAQLLPHDDAVLCRQQQVVTP